MGLQQCPGLGPGTSGGIPALLPPGCVTLGKLLDVSVLSVSYLSNGDHDHAYCLGRREDLTRHDKRFSGVWSAISSDKR